VTAGGWRRGAAAVLIGAGLALASDASDLLLPPASKPVMRRVIIGVIEGQLAAFRSGDTAAAFAAAASPLRARLSIAQFVTLVRRGYPEVWSNERAEFGLVRDDGFRAWVEVRVFPHGGASARYHYELLKEPVGWRISGVVRQAELDPDRT
jgi:hypothetical protein